MFIAVTSRSFAIEQGVRQSWIVLFLNAMRKITRLFLLVLTVSYGVGYIVWRMLLLTPLYDLWWQLRFSEVVSSWLYLPLGLLFVTALFVRDKRMLLALAVPAIMFSVEYGRQFLPNWHLWLTDSAQNPSLRVMTWNTLYTSDIAGEFEATLAMLQPDVVALQEVGYGLQDKIIKTLSKQYPYYEVYYAQASRSVAFLSRYPIVAASSRADLDAYWCYCSYVTIDFHGTPMMVVAAHPPRPIVDYRFNRRSLPSVRNFDVENQQVPFDGLMARVAETKGPMILMGDLNTTEGQPNYWRLRTHLYDAFSMAGWGMGYTYPNIRSRWRAAVVPFVRIDHILVSDHWVARAAWTAQLKSSDHLYVVADLALLAN